VTHGHGAATLREDLLSASFIPNIAKVDAGPKNPRNFALVN
jgi:hypothetical protein